MTDDDQVTPEELAEVEALQFITQMKPIIAIGMLKKLAREVARLQGDAATAIDSVRRLMRERDEIRAALNIERTASQELREKARAVCEDAEQSEEAPSVSLVGTDEIDALRAAVES